MTLFSRRLPFAVAALLAAPLVTAPVPAAAAEVVAVVPFAVPGSEKIQNADDATGILATKLTEKGITPKVLPPTDRLGVVANAAQICAQTGATGILVPTTRTEQAVKFAGIATHAEVMMTTVDCSGTGVSSAIEDAFGHWAEQPLPVAKS